MKKQLFFVACAALALASCSEKETVEMPDSAAIGFGTFVDNATRGGELTTDNLPSFYVFGRAGENNPIFDNTPVTKSGDNWKYSPERYWEQGKVYDFVAYAPALGEGAGTVAPSTDYTKIEFTDFVQGDGDANLDLIVANINGVNVTDPAQMQTQMFTFNHILSMVKFTFESGFGDGVTLTINDVKLNGANSKGSYTNDTWAPATPAVTSQSYTLVAASGEDKNATVSTKAETDGVIVIPQTLTADAVTVTFKVKATYADGSFVAGVDGTYDVTATLPSTQAWEKGNRYNYTAVLTAENTQDPDDPTTLHPIEFGLTSVTGWNNYSDVEGSTVGE